MWYPAVSPYQLNTGGTYVVAGQPVVRAGAPYSPISRALRQSIGAGQPVDGARQPACRSPISACPPIRAPCQPIGAGQPVDGARQPACRSPISACRSRSPISACQSPIRAPCQPIGAGQPVVYAGAPDICRAQPIDGARQPVVCAGAPYQQSNVDRRDANDRDIVNPGRVRLAVKQIEKKTLRPVGGRITNKPEEPKPAPTNLGLARNPVKPNPKPAENLDVELDRLKAFIEKQIDKQQASLEGLRRLPIKSLHDLRRLLEEQLADVQAEITSVDVRNGSDRQPPPDTNENREQLLAVARSLARRMENT